MQEDLEKNNGMESMSIEEMFLKSQESYEDAQLRAQEENRSFARTEFFLRTFVNQYVSVHRHTE